VSTFTPPRAERPPPRPRPARRPGLRPAPGGVP